MASGALETQGVMLEIGDGGGPETFFEVGEVTDFTGPGGSAAVIDVTHLKSTAKEKRMGLPDEGQFTFNVNLVPLDNGQRHAFKSRADRRLTNFRLTLTDSPATVLTFPGFVLEFSLSGAVDDKIPAAITIEISGAVAGFPAPV